jgi:hypothetical protein
LPQARFEEFTGAECRRLLAEHHLGRLAEVDAADEASRTGWNVVGCGPLAQVTDPGDLPFTWWG